MVLASRDLAQARPLVVNLGLAKSGTTSLHAYFVCSGWRSVHWAVDKRWCGDGVRSFITQNHAGAAAFRRALHPSLAFDVYAEINVMWRCVVPQVTGLSALLRLLPDACFTLTVRPAEHWTNSIMAWGTNGGKRKSAGQTLIDCMHTRDRAGLATWYQHQMRRTQTELEQHRRKGGCVHVVHIEDPNRTRIGEELAARFPGTHADCWDKWQGPTSNMTSGRGDGVR